jgi:putative endonuclease
VPGGMRPRGAPGWFVYLLRCGDGSLYTGITTDPPSRVRVHNAGRGARYTRGRLPVLLVHSEPAADRSAALRREAAIKRLSRPRKERLLAARRHRGPRAGRRRPSPRGPREPVARRRGRTEAG